jgi:hypothetical protein
MEWFEDGAVELYDLETDLEERVDLSKTEPEKVQELLSLLRAWRDEVGANMPREDPGAGQENLP